MKLEYKLGTVNVVADALSRAPTDGKMTGGKEGSDVQRVLQPELPQPSMQKVQLEQSKDKELVQLVNFLTKKALPEDPSKAKFVLSLARKGYYVVDGILYYEGADVPD